MEVLRISFRYYHTARVTWYPIPSPLYYTYFSLEYYSFHAWCVPRALWLRWMHVPWPSRWPNIWCKSTVFSKEVSEKSLSLFHHRKYQIYEGKLNCFNQAKRAFWPRPKLKMKFWSRPKSKMKFWSWPKSGEKFWSRPKLRQKIGRDQKFWSWPKIGRGKWKGFLTPFDIGSNFRFNFN